jgi:tripartite-type tricarboxylate transporter receptor subunit TctC
MVASFRRLSILGFNLLAILLSIGIFPATSPGQEYPTKPIQLIMSWPPGGLAPVLSGLVVEEAKKYLSKPVLVVYKTGGGGTIGGGYVAKSPPDGYTLLFARPSHISTPIVQKSDYSIDDFEIIGQIATGPLTLAVKADAPWKTLRELINYAKKNPGLLTCGTSGTYSSVHFHFLRIERQFGIKLSYVPFKGSGDALAALAGGHISLSTKYPGEGEPLVDSGKIKVLTVFDSKRCKFYPNIPTSSEEGFDAEASAWAVLMAPKGTPKPILNTWEDLIRKMASDRSFIDKAEKLHIEIEFKSAADSKKIVLKEFEDFSKIAKELGLKPT